MIRQFCYKRFSYILLSIKLTLAALNSFGQSQCLEYYPSKSFTTQDLLKEQSDSFQLSTFAPIKEIGLHNIYKDWASLAKNAVKISFQRGISIEEIHSMIGSGRKEIAALQNDREEHRFGEVVYNITQRSPNTIFPTTFSIERMTNENDRIKYSKFYELAEEILKKSINHSSASDESHFNTLKTLDGKTINLSNFNLGTIKHEGFNYKKLTINHTSSSASDDCPNFGGAVKVAFEDALKRIEMIRSGKLSDNEKLEQFVMAMFAYQNAMIFPRGSSAVGRVMFTGLFEAIFERPAPYFEDGYDVYAMMLTQEQFLNRMMPMLKEHLKQPKNSSLKDFKDIEKYFEVEASARLGQQVSIKYTDEASMELRMSKNKISLRGSYDHSKNQLSILIAEREVYESRPEPAIQAKIVLLKAILTKFPQAKKVIIHQDALRFGSLRDLNDLRRNVSVTKKLVLSFFSSKEFKVLSDFGFKNPIFINEDKFDELSTPMIIEVDKNE